MKPLTTYFLIATGTWLFTEVATLLLGIAASRTAPKTGPEAIDRGTVSQRFQAEHGESAAHGKVRAAGAIWNATCAADLAVILEVGDRVRVDRVQGLQVEVSSWPGRRGNDD